MKHTLLIFGLLWALGASGQIYINSFTFGAAPAAGLLLDDYPNAAAAYSLRLLRTAYTGNCVRVRRTNDSQLQNIGFSGGIIDTVALKNFCTTNTCVVETWYDQSGNAADVVQNQLGTAQPVIVNAGAVNYFGGQVSINFDGNDRLLRSTSFFSGAGNRTILAVYRPNTVSGAFTYTIGGQSQRNINGTWSTIQARNQIVTGDPYFAGFAADIGNGLSTPSIDRKLAQFYYNGTTGFLYRNATLLGQANITLNADTADDFVIGSTGLSAEFANAQIQEFVVYTTNESANRTGIQSNINSFYSIY